MYRIAINGYGRIGRSIFRALYERQCSGQDLDMQITAINEPADAETILHLTRFDSTHGRFPAPIELEKQQLKFNNQVIQLSHYQAIDQIKWPQIDLVMECSGVITDNASAFQHLQQGAKRVLFSNPATPDVDRTVVMGVNEQALCATDRILSNASCTTNASVPILALIDQHLGIEAVSITTIHSAMNDQPVIDAYHNTDLRKTRSASQSMIPVDTALAKGIGRFLPHLQDCISAQAIRIPTVNVSAMDICIQLKQKASVAAINTLLLEAANEKPSILGFNAQPLASIDFNHQAHSCIIDSTQTRLSGEKLLKLFIWFDNEWSFAHRMLDVAAFIQQTLKDNDDTSD